MNNINRDVDINKNDTNQNASTTAQEQYNQYINKYSPYNQPSHLQNTSTNSYQLPSYQQQQQYAMQQYTFQQQQLYQQPNNNNNNNNNNNSNNNSNNINSNNGIEPFDSNLYNRPAVIGNYNNNYNQNNNQYGQQQQQQQNSDYNFISPINDTINNNANSNKLRNNNNNNNSNNNVSNFNYQLPDMMYTQYMNQLTNKSSNQQQQMQQSSPATFNNMPSNTQYSNPQLYNITTTSTNNNINNNNNNNNSNNSKISSYQQSRDDKIFLNSQENGGQIQDTIYSINNNNNTNNPSTSKFLKPSGGDNNLGYLETVTDNDYSNMQNDPYSSNVFTNNSEYPGDKNFVVEIESPKQAKNYTKKKKKTPTTTSKLSIKKAKKTDSSEEKDTEKKKKDKKKKKQGPKRPSSAYFLYFITMRKQLITDHPDAKVPEIAKIASVQWKNMSIEERKPYNDQFKIHWGEYLVAREAFKKSLPPKRPSGPFIKFTQDMRPKLTNEYPNKNLIEVTKLIGQKWKELTEEGRAVYKDAYKLELRAWEKTVGFKRQNENGNSTIPSKERIYTDAGDDNKVEAGLGP
ncbi:hypothetical protein MOSE0_K03180 [Monosporozyma servazzii]